MAVIASWTSRRGSEPDTSMPGASISSFSVPETSRGKAQPPLPTTRLWRRPGWLAATNRAAAVPTPGLTRCGCSMPHSSRSLIRNSLIAAGESSSGRRSERPKPGRSTATSRAAADRRAHTRSKASRLSGQGLVSTRHRLEELSLAAKRICSPSTVRKPIRMSLPTVTSGLGRSPVTRAKARISGGPPAHTTRSCYSFRPCPAGRPGPAGLDRRGARSGLPPEG